MKTYTPQSVIDWDAINRAELLAKQSSDRLQLATAQEDPASGPTLTWQPRMCEYCGLRPATLVSYDSYGEVTSESISCDECGSACDPDCYCCHVEDWETIAALWKLSGHNIWLGCGTGAEDPVLSAVTAAPIVPLTNTEQQLMAEATAETSTGHGPFTRPTAPAVPGPVFWSSSAGGLTRYETEVALPNGELVDVYTRTEGLLNRDDALLLSDCGCTAVWLSALGKSFPKIDHPVHQRGAELLLPVTRASLLDGVETLAQACRDACVRAMTEENTLRSAC